MQQEAINVPSDYLEAGTYKGIVFEEAKTLKDGQRVLVCQKLFDYLLRDPKIEQINDMLGLVILAWKTDKTIYFVPDLWDLLREKPFVLPTR